MRRVFNNILYEMALLAICIWLLEAIGYIDFIADATYSIELVTRRLHVTSFFSTMVYLFPSLITWFSLTRSIKENTGLRMVKIMNNMFLAAIRGSIYALILCQWNIFQLQQYVIHCSQ